MGLKLLISKVWRKMGLKELKRSGEKFYVRYIAEKSYRTIGN